mgnify:FL=1|tara:strand:+ start:3909 stop:4076 length:168 start_codon:yes stop_codon:yes gene_type:complete
MKDFLMFLKITGVAFLIFIVLLFFPVLLGLGFLAIIGIASWVLSKMLNQEEDPGD